MFYIIGRKHAVMREMAITGRGCALPYDESDGFGRCASHSRADGKVVRRSAGFAYTAASEGFIDLSSCYTELLPCHDGVCFRVSLSAVAPNTIIHRRLLIRPAAVHHCTSRHRGDF